MMAAEGAQLLGKLETYLKGRLGPVFQGRKRIANAGGSYLRSGFRIRTIIRNHGRRLKIVLNRRVYIAPSGGRAMYHCLSPHDVYCISRKVFCVRAYETVRL
jgi:hypothetical protein